MLCIMFCIVFNIISCIKPLHQALHYQIRMSLLRGTRIIHSSGQACGLILCLELQLPPQRLFLFKFSFVNNNVCKVSHDDL